MMRMRRSSSSSSSSFLPAHCTPEYIGIDEAEGSASRGGRWGRGRGGEEVGGEGKCAQQRVHEGGGGGGEGEGGGGEEAAADGDSSERKLEKSGMRGAHYFEKR